jgi:signal transduction histidine kinase
MAEVAGAVATARDYGSLLAQIDRALARHVPIDCAAVFDADGDHLTLKAARGRAGGAAEAPPAPWDPGHWGERVAVHAVTEAATALPSPITALASAVGFPHAAAIPVFGAGALHGLFVVARRGAFSADDVAVLERLAPHIGNAVNNVRLHVRAEHLLRAREELTQLIVHDLRNPLSAVQNNLDVALEDDLPDAERPEILRDARRATQRVIALVSDLLDTSAAEEGRLRLEPAPVDLPALCRDVAQHYSPALGAQYELCVTGDAHAQGLLDAKLVRRVLENIVGNATRYVPRGGRIELAVERRGDRLILAVANDGPTIPLAVRAWLFQKYAGDSHSGRTRGLGLYFCRLVVEAHGGTIRETQPAAGVRFEITLPAPAASEGARPRRASVAA